MSREESLLSTIFFVGFIRRSHQWCTDVVALVEVALSVPSEYDIAWNREKLSYYCRGLFFVLFFSPTASQGNTADIFLLRVSDIQLKRATTYLQDQRSSSKCRWSNTKRSSRSSPIPQRSQSNRAAVLHQFHTCQYSLKTRRVLAYSSCFRRSSFSFSLCDNFAS